MSNRAALKVKSVLKIGVDV